jgi:hypothetical protein
MLGLWRLQKVLKVPVFREDIVQRLIHNIVGGCVDKCGILIDLISALRMPAYINEDLSISKRTTIHDNLNLQFQANFFNAFNRTIFSSGGNAQTFIANAAPPNLSQAALANSQTVFGIMAAQQNGARSIQFGLRLEF